MPDGCLEIPRSSRYRLDKGFLMDALHFWRSQWLELASRDAELHEVIVAWDTLTGAIRCEVLALIRSQSHVRPASSAGSIV